MGKKIYEKADEATMGLLYEVMARYHRELHESEVAVALTMARKFDKDDEPIPCVKCHGVSATAVCRLISAKRRVYDENEVEIEVDGLLWDHMTEPSRIALLDHELNHIKFILDAHGIVQQDDAGRPKLKLICDDFLLTGFHDIIRRHGDHALEWQSVSAVYEKAREMHGYHQTESTAPVAEAAAA